MGIPTTKPVPVFAVHAGTEGRAERIEPIRAVSRPPRQVSGLETTVSDKVGCLSLRCAERESNGESCVLYEPSSDPHDLIPYN